MRSDDNLIKGLRTAPAEAIKNIACHSLAYHLDISLHNARNTISRITHLKKAGESETEILHRLNPDPKTTMGEA